MEKHRNIVLTDAETVITNLGINTENYMEAMNKANEKIASAQMNLEVNERALENLEEFLEMIDLSKNQLKYTASMIGGIEDLTTSAFGGDDDGDGYGGYGSRSSLVQEPFRAEAIIYEETFNAQREILTKATSDTAAKVEGFKTIMTNLITNMKPLMAEMERVQNNQRDEERKLLEIRALGENQMDGARINLEKKKIEIHQKVLDNKCVIENTNKLMYLYKTNLETDIKASFSEDVKKKIEEEEHFATERERLTVLKTMYDESLLNEQEYTDKKKEELENFEIKKLKEKLTSLENSLSNHAYHKETNK